MIKTILFDLVGVLLFKKRDYTPLNNDQINAEKIERLYNHTDDLKLINDIKNNLKLNDTEIDKALSLIPEKYEKFASLWEILPELKKNYKLAIINNGNSLANKYWMDRFDFSIFDLFINSGIEKVKKPDPEIYSLVINRLSTTFNECLFLDDSIENITGAEKLGIKTIWWNKKVDRQKLLDKFIDILKYI